MEWKRETSVFDPHSPAYRWRLWLKVGTAGGSAYYVFWRRIALVALTLLVAGWLTAAGGAWAFLRYRRGHREVRYVDLAFYPWRAEQFRVGIARHYLQLGHAAMQKREYREGYALLTAGLRRVPDDVAARRSVAIMQVRLGLVHRAIDTLIEGLQHPHDLDFVKLTFGWMLEAREDERLLAVAQTLLPAKPDNELEHLYVALQVAIVHFERGRYDEAERVVNDWGLTKSLEGQILLARCDSERGLADRALQRLEGEVTRFAKRDELYLELVRLHRAQGHRGETRRYALLRRFNDPRSPGPRIDMLYAYHEADDRAEEARELEQYFADFSADPRALDELAWFAAGTHQAVLLGRIRELAQSQQFSPANLVLAQIQEAIEREAYADALSFIEAAAMEKESYQARVLEGMRAVARFGARDPEGGHRAMGALMEKAGGLRASDALLFARQLRLLGVPHEARALLERACIADPLNERTLAELARLEADAGDRAALANSLPKLLKLRKPSRAVLEEILLKLQRPEDASLAQQIRAALARSAPGAP